jgi:hypothetical protein
MFVHVEKCTNTLSRMMIKTIYIKVCEQIIYLKPPEKIEMKFTVSKTSY